MPGGDASALEGARDLAGSKLETKIWDEALSQIPETVCYHSSGTKLIERPCWFGLFLLVL